MLKIGELETAPAASRKHEKQDISASSPLSQKYGLGNITNLYDFETIARASLSPKSWAFVNSGIVHFLEVPSIRGEAKGPFTNPHSLGANDNITRDANIQYLQRIWFRPAIMRNVGAWNTRTNLFGCELDFPVYIAPAGAAKAVCDEGELALARGAAATGTIHCIATTASYPLQDILDATPKQAFFQLYVNKDRSKTEQLVRQATQSGKVRAIFVTADLPVMSKREADERVKSHDSNVDTIAINKGNTAGGRKSEGLAKSNSSFIDPSLNWKDIQWLRGLTSLPILVKGVQRAQDARIAMEMGLDGIVIGNHGGRAADTSTPAILILLEVHRYCPEAFQRMTVLVDGGFRRGSDVIKALCLGAKAVGFGRPFMYALNYGQEGLEHAVNSMS